MMPTGQHGAGLRAAVVDDDRLTRYLVRKTLEAAGFDVEEADTGAGGLRLALGKPDVMVLDLHLPDMSGIAVCNAMRASDVAIVVLTATDDDKTTQQCFRAGAQDCVPKPVEPAVLSERIEQAVKTKKENSSRSSPSAPSPAAARPLRLDDHEERAGLVDVDVKKKH